MGDSHTFRSLGMLSSAKPAEPGFSECSGLLTPGPADASLSFCSGRRGVSTWGSILRFEGQGKVRGSNGAAQNQSSALGIRGRRDLRQALGAQVGTRNSILQGSLGRAVGRRAPKKIKQSGAPGGSQIPGLGWEEVPALSCQPGTAGPAPRRRATCTH